MKFATLNKIARVIERECRVSTALTVNEMIERLSPLQALRTKAEAVETIGTEIFAIDLSDDCDGTYAASTLRSLIANAKDIR